MDSIPSNVLEYNVFIGGLESHDECEHRLLESNLPLM